tara:strand:+ start:190 stop:1044 length:855 start_codon:yes stop_codon:yes gene_type:complete
MRKKVGFIGAGYMGYGIAKNILSNNFDLNVIAHKNREPIEKLVKLGAKEFFNYNDLVKDIDCLIICVTNTPIAKDVAKEVLDKQNPDTLFIDITTHYENGSIEMEKILSQKKIKYVECPVMGGPVQAEEGILGGIIGASKNNFKEAKQYLMSFCENIFHFGDVGVGAKAKLISNFLSLGTATFVIESIKAANHFNIDLQKLYDVAKLGSGNSGALKRIADKAVKDDYTGYIFSVDNTLKDFTYINEMLKDLPNAAKLSSLAKSFYEEASKKGYGNLLVSELIKK